MVVTAKRRNYVGGGLRITTIKQCRPRVQAKTCLNEFLQENHWLEIPIKGDGNCFFRTIEEYYKRTGIESHAPHASRDHIWFRNHIVNFIKEMIIDELISPDPNDWEIINKLLIEDDVNWNSNSNSNSNSNNNSNQSYNDDVEFNNMIQQSSLDEVQKIKLYQTIMQLKTPGIWDSDAFDIVPEYAAEALRININIYDSVGPSRAKRVLNKVIEGKKTYRKEVGTSSRIIKYEFIPEEPAHTTIDMLRIDEGHYELLMPASNINVKNKVFVKSTATKKKKNAANAPSPRKRSNSLNNALAQISLAEANHSKKANNIQRLLNKASSGRPLTKKEQEKINAYFQ